MIRYDLYLPLAAISLGYLILRWFYFGGLGDLEGTDQLLPWLSYAEAEGVLIYKYLWQTLWPSGLSIDHRVFPNAWPDWINACAWLSIFGFCALALAQMSKGPLRRCVSFSWLYFIVCLLPTSSVFPTVDLYVERRAYLADAGLFLLVGGMFCAAAQRSARFKKILALICAALVSLEASLAYGRIQVYQSPEKLWQESLSLDPENPRALLNLGVYFSAVGRFAEARTALEDLLHAQPQNGSILSKLGYLYQQPLAPFHDEEKAWDYFTQSLQLYPENIFALYNSGVWLMNHGRNAEAEDFFVRAVRLSPQMSKAYLAAGQAALAQDRRVQAIQYLEEALRLDPTLTDAQTLIARLRP